MKGVGETPYGAPKGKARIRETLRQKDCTPTAPGVNPVNGVILKP